MNTYDIVIIGSGGGAKMALALARLGRRVALIEKDRAGGTCLNRGCIPSKMLIYPASLSEKIRAGHKLHIDVDWRGVQLDALTSSINTYTDQTSEGIAGKFMEMENADYYQGTARLLSNKVVQVENHQLSADTIVIATGSRPYIPDWPGLHDTPYMTSTEALRNRTLPKRLIVAGGGYIATELGGAYAGLGSDVTFLLRSTFLKYEDQEIVDRFAKEFSKNKTIHEHTSVQNVEWHEGVFTVQATASDGKSFTIEGDALLVATGVVPNSDELGLEQAGVKTNQNGFIEVDAYLQTSAPGIYAIGDVAGNYLFRHSVNFEVEYWVQAQCLEDDPYPIEYPPMPSAVFTHPEIASVGLTEEAARAQGKDIIVGRADYTSVAMALARGLDHGLVKLLVERTSGKLLGAHFLGEEAATMIQECVLAMTAGMTVDEMYRQVYIHPAFPEVVRNALRDVIRQRTPERAILF